MQRPTEVMENVAPVSPSTVTVSQAESGQPNANNNDGGGGDRGDRVGYFSTYKQTNPE